MITHTQKQRMPRLRSKAYKVTLPASYTEDDLVKIEKWSYENCYRAAIVKTDDGRAVWVAVRESTRTKGDWLRHVRGVFSALRLDVRPLIKDGWVALCTDAEALEIIRHASGTTRRDTPTEHDATHVLDDDTNDARDILMPSGGRRAGAGRTRTQTSFEIVKTH